MQQTLQTILKKETGRAAQAIVDKLSPTIQKRICYKVEQRHMTLYPQPVDELNPDINAFRHYVRDPLITLKQECDQFLSSADSAREVAPASPLFMIHAVTSNPVLIPLLQKIDDEMRSGQSRLLPVLRYFVNEIKNGRWDALSEPHFRKMVGTASGSGLEDVTLRHILFYAYWRSHDTEQLVMAEHETALEYLVLQEQCGNGETPAYRDIRHKDTTFTFRHSPADITMIRLVENGELTEGGHGLVRRLAQRLQEDKAYPVWPQRANGTFPAERFIRYLRQLPENQQVMFDVHNVSYHHFCHDEGMIWWHKVFFHNFRNLVPGMLYEERHTKKKKSSLAEIEREAEEQFRNNLRNNLISSGTVSTKKLPDRFSFSVLSFGSELAFRRLFTKVDSPRAAALPVSCLGVIGVPTLRLYHKQRIQPVCPTMP